jgi:translation initiation factor 1
MAKREPAARAGAETRLVYSTDGGAAAPVGGGAGGSGTGQARTKAAARAPATGGGKGIRVRLERRPGGRDITTVLGVPGSAEAVASLARDLRAACGAGGTVRDGVIELQGDQTDKVRRALSERGIKSR